MENIHLIELECYDPALPGTRTLRFCTGVGLTTKPSENPANAMYLPRVKQPGLTRTDIFGRGTTGGASTMGHGEIVLTNIDGGLDGLIDYGFDGRTLTHRVGPARLGAYPADYPVVETYTMEQLRFGWADIRIIVRDKQYLLDRPLQPNIYAGSNSLPNGLEGVADLQGKPKPLIYGSVQNVSLPLVNTSKLIYQLCDSAINSATLYDRGLVLAAGADYASEGDLMATAPAAGQYRIYKAGGYARLGSTPSGLITADVVQGAATSNRTAGQIINAIALQMGLSAGEVSSSDIAALDTANSAECGAAFLAETSGRQALDALCQTLGAWWMFDVAGLLRVQILTAPTGSPVVTLTTTDIQKNISRDPTGDKDRGLPLWKVAVNYRQNHNTQTSDLAGAVTAVRRAELAEQWLSVTATDNSVQTKHLLAGELAIETNYTSAVAAQAEADRLLALRSVRRDRLNIKLLSNKFSAIALGDVVKVQLPRFGFDNGKLFITIGRQPDYKTGRGELTLWG